MPRVACLLLLLVAIRIPGLAAGGGTAVDAESGPGSVG